MVRRRVGAARRPDDADTKANLAISARARRGTRRRAAGRGEGKLEARLDAVIDEQRKLLDGTRATAWLAIKQAGGSDPLAQQSATLGKLADDERGIVAGGRA